MQNRCRPAATLAAAAALSCVASVHADIIYHSAAERPDRVFLTNGFEDMTPGTTVEAVDFGFDLVAQVSTSNNISNRIFSVTDNYGAVAGEGENFWKLAGGTTTLDFGQTRLHAIEFLYSDLEWTTLSFEFDNGSAFTFRDSNSMTPKLLGYEADQGNPFRRVSITWVGKQNDGVGFDNMSIAAVPSPAGLALLTPVAFAFTRRRRTA